MNVLYRFSMSGIVTRKRKRENLSLDDHNKYYEEHTLFLFINSSFKKFDFYIPKELIHIIVKYHYLQFHQLTTYEDLPMIISLNNTLAKSCIRRHLTCSECLTKFSILETVLPLKFRFFRYDTSSSHLRFGIVDYRIPWQNMWIGFNEKSWTVRINDQISWILNKRQDICVFEMKYNSHNNTISIYLNNEPLRCVLPNGNVVLSIPSTFQLEHTHFWFNLIWDRNALVLL